MPIALVRGKFYERCELASELRDKHNVPVNQIGDWVCITELHSGLNTNYRDYPAHGLFKISEHWCSTKRCKLNCEKLLDDDINDDVACVQKIQALREFIVSSAWNRAYYGNNCSVKSADRKVYYLRGIVSTGASKQESCDADKYSTFTNILYYTQFVQNYDTRRYIEMHTRTE